MILIVFYNTIKLTKNILTNYFDCGLFIVEDNIMTNETKDTKTADLLIGIKSFNELNDFNSKLMRSLKKEDTKSFDEHYNPLRCYINIKELYDDFGVTDEDLQKLYDENPEILKQIGGGPTCEEWAKQADKVETKYDENNKAITGGCLAGVQNIANMASMGDTLSVANLEKYRKDYQGNSNGGCATHLALDASGDFMSIKIKNEAYGLGYDGKNSLMDNIVGQLQPGVIISCDSIEDEKMRDKMGNTLGGRYGHVAVKRNDGCLACDFKQTDVNFGRYGEFIYVSYPKDAQMNRYYAKKLVEIASERQKEVALKKKMAEEKARQEALGKKMYEKLTNQLTKQSADSTRVKDIYTRPQQLDSMNLAKRKGNDSR